MHLVYSLTTIPDGNSLVRSRTVALYSTFDRAEAALVETGDFWWESEYIYAVIEQVYIDQAYGGITGRQQWWYQWSGGHAGSYRPLPAPPEEHRQIFGFGIG